MKNKKEHPLTFFRKANEARQKIVKTSLAKAQKGRYTVTNADGSPITTPSNYTPPSVPTYPDFKKLKKTDPSNHVFMELAVNPENFNPKDVKKYGPKRLTKRQIRKMNMTAPEQAMQATPYKKGGITGRKK